VKAVTGELVSRDIGAELAAFRSHGDEIANHLAKGGLRSCNVVISMNERRQFAVVPARLMRQKRVSLEDSGESLVCRRGPVSELGELLEVSGDLAFVPGQQDRFDIGEVLVQRCSSDPGPACDLRHRHGEEAAFGDQSGGRVEDRVANFAAMRLDRLRPQLGHRRELYATPTSIHTDVHSDNMYGKGMPDNAGHEVGTTATPLWVKVVVIVGIFLLVLVVVLLLTGRGGGHGPGRHMERGNDTPGQAFRPA
jgi:hypothetical protein